MTISIQLSQVDIVRLRRIERVGRAVERKTQAAFQKIFDESIEAMTMAISDRRPLPEVNFEDVLLWNAFESMKAGFEEATLKSRPVKLASNPPPRIKIPSTLAELMQWWDVTRRVKKTPPRIKALANRIKKAYLKKCQSVWDAAAESFRVGKIFTQEQARQELQAAAKTTWSRSAMIVATETTHYYNQATMKHYESVSSVTHYLFVSIGDKRTTPWCQDYRKHGRDGLVYTKGSELLKKERPPCHWNCRSRILPLTPFNPAHKKLIDDLSIRREAHKPTPLPPGWNGEASE